MRGITFRGKRVDNGEWVKGDLLHVNNRILILAHGCAFEVVAETVGQYTGLTDKNGKKIFEGDVLAGDIYPFTSDEEQNYFAEVVWFDNSPAFGLLTHKNPKSKVCGISDGNTDYMEDFDCGNWEIIGKIHDNPELLKGGE